MSEVQNNAAATPSRARSVTATTVGLWLIGLGLLGNAAIMLTKSKFPDEISFDSKAFGQAGGGVVNSGRGITWAPAQLGPNTWGVCLVDNDSSTLVVYRFAPEVNRLKLMAARTWKDDRKLEDFNNEAPTPKDTARMAEIQQQRRDLHQADTQPGPATQPEEKKDQPEN